MSEIRILHIMSSFGGGISTFIYNLAKGAKHQQMIFDVATYSRVPADFQKAIEATGGRIYQLDNPKKTSWSAFKHSYAQAFHDNSYQAVYCHISGYRALIYYLLANRLQEGDRFDFYIHAHYRYLDNDSSLRHKLSRLIDPVINKCLSRLPIGCSRSSVEELFNLKPDASFVVIPNSIEPNDFFFDWEDKKAAHNFWLSTFNKRSDNSLLIGQIGRLTAVKNHSFTFDIVSYSKTQTQQLLLVIAGDGADRDSLEAQVHQKEIERQVFFAGRISPIRELLVGIDLLIMPSLSEGFGTIAIEAQAAGVPVVASDQIPQEVDLGFGLIQFVSLDSDPEFWYQSIINFYHQAKNKIPNQQERLKEIQAKSFTNDAAAELYRQVLVHQVNHFQIDSR
ncbi:glycosyltransferase [Facklamia miroungae]|uniref:Glycosyltransferase involved in cell wall bisynthesis n=1 Tax=Facklamia miroungae TaxID=120956 RepID=A0A1G7TKT4_9LACT|nr:glycosyltransferase [Facklamia miroungae]NKZ29822.1 glycosyltransferase family 1 protein [Facklamia miroungae]SDG35120.1 Glycosyltransferase involved in cell wall bisynthesis [Facklamia miroungae]